MARMIDISGKDSVPRTAIATGSLLLDGKTIDAIRKGIVKKGDVITASKLAGIQAAKATSTVLPLCHQVPLTSIEISATIRKNKVDMECRVSADYKTGVEMEALVGVTVALLNAWDMVKYLEKDSKGQYPATRISDIRVMEKSKGVAGHGHR